MLNMNLTTIIISNGYDVDRITKSIESIKAGIGDIKEYIIAIKGSEHNCDNELKAFCNKAKIKYIFYENEKYLYFGLPETIKSKYINYINSGDEFIISSKFNTEIEIKDISERIYIASITHIGKYGLNRVINSVDYSNSANIIDEPERFWIHINSVFFDKDLLLELSNQAWDIDYFNEIILLNCAIMYNKGFYALKGLKLLSCNPLENTEETKDECYDIKWYENIFLCINRLFSFAEKNFGDVNDYVKYIAVYLIKTAIFENTNSKNKHILSSNGIERYYSKAKSILEKIDDTIIINTLGNKLINYYLIKLKNSIVDNKYQIVDGELCVVSKDGVPLFLATDYKLRIWLMEYSDGYIKVTGSYKFPFDKVKIRIFTEINGERLYVNHCPVYTKFKSFGRVLYEEYAFEVSIPIDVSSDKTRFVKFFVEYDGHKYQLELAFVKPLSKLAYKNNYWICGNNIINYRDNALKISKKSLLLHIFREAKCMLSIFRKSPEIAKLRFLYFITKPFFRSEIWLFQDKIYKAGDNGEYLFSYASQQNDGIKKYYILNDDSIDAKRFKEEGKTYIPYGSLKHKLLFLNSRIIFATHKNSVKQHGFSGLLEKSFRDVYNFNNVCIQHGLSVQSIPNLVNRIDDNLKALFLASPVEYNNVMNEEYAYEGYEERLIITGSPRYDGLKNCDKKQILITPSWRNYLAMPALTLDEARRYSNTFKESEYYKIYNKLINNSRLIDCAKENGYNIVYLLHPVTSAQIGDYDKNEYVELVAATDDLSYEKILTESSLMVTDYSGVQFDFAYMYKPIIYFHPDELPPSYEEGAYIYDTMALGEITKTLDETIDLMCEYMSNSCNIKDEYRSRIDRFFKYHDYNNCKRIYDEIMQMRETGAL